MVALLQWGKNFFLLYSQLTFAYVEIFSSSHRNLVFCHMYIALAYNAKGPRIESNPGHCIFRR
jgi:hypothetical protein